MLSSIQYISVIIAMKGCEVDPCTDYVDNPLVSQNVLYDGPFTPKLQPGSGSSGVSQTFVSQHHTISSSASDVIQTLTAPQYGNGPAHIFAYHRYNLGVSTFLISLAT